MHFFIIVSITFVCNFISFNSFAETRNITGNKKIFQLCNKIEQNDWNNARLILTDIKSPILSKIFFSKHIIETQGKDYNFKQIANFLLKNPHWPQRVLISQIAENKLTDTFETEITYKYFTRYSPITALGYKYYALATIKTQNDPVILMPIIKNGWYYGEFDNDQALEYYTKYKKYINELDSVSKINSYLMDKSLEKASIFLQFVSKPYQETFNTTIELIHILKKFKKEKNKTNIKINDESLKKAKLLYNKVNKKYLTSSLIYNYLTILSTYSEISTDTKNQNSQIEHINKAIKDLKSIKDAKNKCSYFNPIKRLIARNYIKQARYNDAYLVISQHISKKPINISESEFLSGFIALHFLNKPDLALTHFQKFYNIVNNYISIAKALYWQARSYNSLGQKEQADKIYNKLAKEFSTSIYGQLANLKINHTTIDHSKFTIIKNLNNQLDSENKYKSNKQKYINELVRAIKLLDQNCQPQYQLVDKYIDAIFQYNLSYNDIIELAKKIDKLKNIHNKLYFAKLALQQKIIFTEMLYPTQYKTLVKQTSIEPALIFAIINRESMFDPNEMGSSKELGLMQIMNDTAKVTANTLNIKYENIMLKKPEYNIMIGSNYLKTLIDKYNGSYLLAIAAYNAGPNAVDNWIKTYGDPRKYKNIDDVMDWIQLIPFHVTRDYVLRVLELLQVYRTIITKKNFLRIRNDLIHR